MNNLKIIKRLLKTHVTKYYKEFLIIVFFMIATGISTAGIAWLLDPAIKKIFIEKDKTMLFIIPAAIVITFIVKSVSVYLTKVLSLKVAFKIVKNIQILLADKVLNSDISYIHSNHSGKFISNFTYDTNILGSVLNNNVIGAVKEIITLIFLLSLMFYKDVYLSLLAIILIPIAAFFSRKLGKKMGKAVSQLLISSDIFIKNLSEILKANPIIKIFQKEKEELEKFSIKISDRINKLVKTEKTRLGAGPVMETITGFAIALVVFAGGYRSINGQMEIGAFFSFLTALMLAYQPVRALAGINIAINEGLSAAKRIYNIMDNENKIFQNKNLKDLEFKHGDIEFKNVHMQYVKNVPVLRGININVRGGEKIALVGNSGSGKSTILNLIPRFYDPTEGSINIDNQNIKNVNIFSLRKYLALVSQDIILFDDTVKSNIIYGNPNASDSEIYQATKDANCHEFISKLENGYDTIIGENGVKLSGGQKQRLSIARAILKNSPIILLDEATSALDTESEKIVQNAIENLTRKKTTIIIAHRLSTVINANKIYVINNGVVAESGSHNQLMENSKIYKNLVSQQNLK